MALLWLSLKSSKGREVDRTAWTRWVNVEKHGRNFFSMVTIRGDPSIITCPATNILAAQKVIPSLASLRILPPRGDGFLCKQWMLGCAGGFHGRRKKVYVSQNSLSRMAASIPSCACRG